MSAAVSIVPDALKPVAQRYNYSSAVRAGDFLFCAGQVGRDADMKVVEGTEAQFVQTFENCNAVLAAAGATWADVIDVVTFHVGLQAHLAEFIAVKDRYIPRTDTPPAWTAIGVTEMSTPGMIIEIKMTAYLPGR